MIHVLYHNHCADGFLSRVIAQRKLGFAVKFHAVNYKEPVPAAVLNDLNAEVFILDFSYPRHDMENIQRKALSVVCLDHHKTAQADLEGLDFCTFDMTKSGAMLAWEHFNPGVPAPEIVKYVQNRDLGFPWSDPEKALPDCLEIHAGLFRAMPRTYDAWSELLDQKDLTDLALNGEKMMNLDRRIFSTVAQTPIWIEIGGHKVPAAQLSHEYISDACNAMLNVWQDAPFAAAWFVSSTSGQVTYSLRSRKGGFDVSALAKSFGGGGHAQAAGFSSNEPPQFVESKWLNDTNGCSE